MYITESLLVYNNHCNYILNICPVLASWSSCNAFIFVAEGLRFKSWAGQIKHSVANSSPLRDIFSKGAMFVAWCKDTEMGPANSLVLGRNTVSIMKALILI